MIEPTYIDEKGRTWKLFSVCYTHEIDEQKFSFEIWAIDFADAEERVEYIKKNAKLEYQVLGKVSV